MAFDNDDFSTEKERFKAEYDRMVAEKTQLHIERLFKLKRAKEAHNAATATAITSTSVYNPPAIVSDDAVHPKPTANTPHTAEPAVIKPKETGRRPSTDTLQSASSSTITSGVARQKPNAEFPQNASPGNPSNSGPRRRISGESISVSGHKVTFLDELLQGFEADLSDSRSVFTVNKGSHPKAVADTRQDVGSDIPSNERSRQKHKDNGLQPASLASTSQKEPHQKRKGKDLQPLSSSSTSQKGSRQSAMAEDHQDAGWSSDESLSFPPAPKRQKARKPKSSRQLPAPIFKATVGDIADHNTVKEQGGADVDPKIMERIKKCWDRATHSATPDAEKKASFNLASRLMSQYNVSKAEVLANESVESRSQYAGESTILIQRTDGDESKHVSEQAFVEDLCWAMSKFFDCGFYTEVIRNNQDIRILLRVAFYGIADNTIAASMGFEVAYGLIVEWARFQKGSNKKNSYCLGAAEEMYMRAQREKTREEQAALKAEQERKAQEERTYKESEAKKTEQARQMQQAWDHISISSSPEPSEILQVPTSASPQPDRDDYASPSEAEEQEDEGAFDARPDFDTRDGSGFQSLEDVDRAIRELSKAKSPSPEPQASWKSHMQLTLFRNTAKQIAEDYIESKGFKFTTSAARKRPKLNEEAFEKGRKDSKKIDPRRKRIEEAKSSM